ncbi:GNAT family N-acetyltransferase [Frankia tisae]|uniref:GNAT family N-acetyltransferase n=1 Tax=Frankia tisae TaxID=2950104 RepID=UPI0021C07CD3|nr:GNAT family N-acetyltransferase [Frankia tisae]
MPSLEPVEITAGRLHLRPWRPYDVDAVHQACQDPEIPRWTRLPTPYGRHHAEDFVTREAPRSWADGTGAAFAVVDATTEQLLASVALLQITTRSDAEIGYWCAAPARGQGVMSQAVATLTRWAFGALGLARIEWRAAVGNVASLRVAEKNGYTLEGTLRQALVVGDGRRVDCWVGSRLPGDPPPPGDPRR